MDQRKAAMFAASVPRQRGKLDAFLAYEICPRGRHTQDSHKNLRLLHTEWLGKYLCIAEQALLLLQSGDTSGIHIHQWWYGTFGQHVCTICGACHEYGMASQASLYGFTGSGTGTSEGRCDCSFVYSNTPVEEVVYEI